MTDDIQLVLTSIYPHSHIQIHHIYHSKKNKVYHINIDDQSYIIKRFPGDRTQQMKTETTLLQRLPQYFNSPTVYDINKKYNTVLMEYIKGDNLCDIINDHNISYQQKNDLIHQLADWFFTFHNIMKTDTDYRIKGDAHIRNFISQEMHIWGVDYEESDRGNPVLDIAEICVSLLTSNPVFTDEKIDLCISFLQVYTMKIEKPLHEFEYFFNKTFTTVLRRRPCSTYIQKQYQKHMDKLNYIFKIVS